MKYLFDMDGVLLDWEGSFIPVYGDPTRMTEEELNSIKKIISKGDFYLNLKPLEEGIALFNHLKSLGDVAILTSVGKFNSEHVTEQKKQSLINIFGYLPEFHAVQSSKDKAKFAKMGTLFDDRVKAVMPFRAAGGKAVLFQDSAMQALEDMDAS